MKYRVLSRKDFIRKTGMGAGSIALASLGMKAQSYGRIMGANDRVNVGIIGFSSRTSNGILPSFFSQARELNFTVTAVSDIWNRRREEAKEFFQKQGGPVDIFRNNEELYDKGNIDAVIIGTADFQHALHTIEAVNAGKDAYVEKPFAETMDDNNKALDAVQKSDRIIQMGTQRRSSLQIKGIVDFVQSGQFGEVVMVELKNNRNSPERWYRPQLVASLKEVDTDWKRYLMNRPYEAWDPRKYIEYRWHWPYSSGIIGQWMSHHIDQLQWITGTRRPRSVVAHGGHYLGHDLNENHNTVSVLLDYGPDDNPAAGFQVFYTSRFTNAADRNARFIFSNRGRLNLQNNQVTPDGAIPGFELEASLIPPGSLEVTETGDGETTNHVRNWMECIRSRRRPTADTQTGYDSSIPNIMANAALRTGKRATFDEKTRQVVVGGKPFTY